MTQTRLFVAGNWKMNGLAADLAELEALKAQATNAPGVDIAVFPPATLIIPAAKAVQGSKIAIGAQDCHEAASGAFTGDISAPMLKNAGAHAVILGHSERRALHGETSALVRKKATAAIEAGLNAIICLGETQGERRLGFAKTVCLRQLAESVPDSALGLNTTIAYEPVWAIGTGLVPSNEDIAEMHDVLREALARRFGPQTLPFRILYGGSVSPDNARTIFACKEVDGALVGGASLKAASFSAIIAAAEQASAERVAARG